MHALSLSGLSHTLSLSLVPRSPPPRRRPCLGPASPARPRPAAAPAHRPGPAPLLLRGAQRRRPAGAAPAGGPAPPAIAAGARARRSRVARPCWRATRRRLLRLTSDAIRSPSCHAIPRGGPTPPGPGSRIAAPLSAVCINLSPHCFLN